MNSKARCRQYRSCSSGFPGNGLPKFINSRHSFSSSATRSDSAMSCSFLVRAAQGFRGQPGAFVNTSYALTGSAARGASVGAAGSNAPGRREKR